MKKIIKAIKNLFKRIKIEIKQLGWFWGIISVIIAGVIFYLPSIVLLILYIVTLNEIYLGSAIGYVMWWFLPMGSPALLVYFAILSFVIVIINKIKKKDKVKEIVIEEKEVKNYGRKEKNI